MPIEPLAARDPRRTYARRGGVIVVALLLGAAGCHDATRERPVADGSVATRDLGAAPSAADLGPPPCSDRVVSSRLVDVKRDYGARGDGVSDDTAALVRAIAEHVGTSQTLYLPTGTYLVRQTLDWRDSGGHWRSYLTLAGAGAGCTTIRLADDASGFDDATAPAPVVRTASKTDDPACSNYNDDSGDGGGNCAFGNFVTALTIDSGAHAGAIGLDFTASNYGAVRDVTVRGQGTIGLRLERAVGPALVTGVQIEGFATGIRIGGELYGLTLEHITLSNQTSIGLYNQDNLVALRDVTSHNRVPAVANHGIGNLVLVDAQLQGGDGESAAISNFAAENAVLLARNVVTSGYGSAIVSGSTTVPGGTVDELRSNPTLSFDGSGPSSLGLAVQETPQLTGSAAPAVDVTTFGAVPDDGVDDSAALQAAIDSGAVVVELPLGTYTLDETVELRGALQRLDGDSSILSGSATPALRTGALTAGHVIIAQTRGLQNGVQHGSIAALAIRDAVDIVVQPQAGGGPIFLEDVCCAPLTLSGQTLFARQWNVEAPVSPRIDNQGGTMWILGLKTEGTETVLRASAGARTELLGGLLYATGGPRQTAFDISDSATSLTFTEVAYSPDVGFGSYVTVAGSQGSGVVDGSAGSYHGLGRIIPLFRSAP